MKLINCKPNGPPWSEELVRRISEDHFDDGHACVISDPDAFDDLRVDAYRYNDEPGFAVDHDLAMNNERSDFTALFEFKKTEHGYEILLEDIHVLFEKAQQSKPAVA
ncbi:DUF7668 domain-containing protein [Pseudoduganella sp. HUAS MS19]